MENFPLADNEHDLEYIFDRNFDDEMILPSTPIMFDDDVFDVPARLLIFFREGAVSPQDESDDDSDS
jgi:hypothetical protein